MSRRELTQRFHDRADAGQRLADALAPRVDPQAIVLGLPRGGVVVAAVVAQRLGLPLDVVVVRKLGAPGQPELGLGAVGEGGVVVLNDRVVASARVDDVALRALERELLAEVARRALLLRDGTSRLRVADRIVVVVDDGLATGGTARAACEVVRREGASRVVLAVPVAPPGADRVVEGAADEFVVLLTPEDFFAVGEFYDDFAPVRDDEVVRLLAEANRPT